jgi:hypothetical protein
MAEPEESSVGKERIPKHVPAATSPRDRSNSWAHKNTRGVRGVSCAPIRDRDKKEG